MARSTKYLHLHGSAVAGTGISHNLIADAVAHAHRILDEIDDKLLEVGSERLGGIVELANLSAILGNIFAAGVAARSGGRFTRNKPHNYPDLLANKTGLRGVEVKVSLEQNPPKGHLAKEGKPPANHLLPLRPTLLVAASSAAAAR